MSRPDTVDHQRRRFTKLGLHWTELPRLMDVDEPPTPGTWLREFPNPGSPGCSSSTR